jgi:ankyrin repeat protein
MGKFSVNSKLFKTILVGIILSLSFNCAGTSSNPDQVKTKNNLALIEAARKGDRGLLLDLIKQGADINTTDKEGYTPYLAASVEGRWEIAFILKGLGAKTEAIPPEEF